jgi:hypothetical protein
MAAQYVICRSLAVLHSAEWRNPLPQIIYDVVRSGRFQRLFQYIMSLFSCFAPYSFALARSLSPCAQLRVRLVRDSGPSTI